MALVRIKVYRQYHKIADRLEQNPHIVLSQMGNQHIFKVQPKDARDQEGIKILHQNMLYPSQLAWNSAQATTNQIPMQSVMAFAKANLLMDLHFGDVSRRGGELVWVLVLPFGKWMNRGMPMATKGYMVGWPQLVE